MEQRTFIVHYSGGLFPSREVQAINKTWARRIAQGELKAGLKITLIEEVKGENK